VITSDFLKLMSCFNDKSQGTVATATHLTFGEIFNCHIFTNLLLQLPVKKLFLNQCTFDKIARKKVDCMLMIVNKSKQFPVMIM